ncbi:glutathione S-transferase family protein [Marinomonas sp. TI.3.20]|uniref:glutathione S-transferase family protein n=1 Tax=Marinomonas sp. TI.3.20 TaxID=3121296 RepID=UPI00311E8305
MANFDFYYAKSGNSLRAAIAIELAGVDVNKHELNLVNMEHKENWFLDISPAGTVPALVDRKQNAPSLILAQSGAIMRYMVEQYRPDLLPDTPEEQAKCMASFIAALSDVAVQNTLARYLNKSKQASTYIFDRMISSIYASFLTVKSSNFLCGEEVTIADYAHFPVIHMREGFFRSEDRATHIISWLERMKMDPAINVAISYAGFQLIN